MSIITESHEITRDGKNSIATIYSLTNGFLFTGRITSEYLEALNDIALAYELRHKPVTPESGDPFVKINKAEYNLIMKRPVVG